MNFRRLVDLIGLFRGIFRRLVVEGENVPGSKKTIWMNFRRLVNRIGESLIGGFFPPFSS